jgi:hypothetical protein
MKSIKSLFMGAAIAVQLTGVSSGRAQELYPAFVDAVSVSTNGSTGNLTYHFFRNQDLFRACAAELGTPALPPVSLVYNRTADTLEVVNKTNSTVVYCTPVTFSGGTSLSNTNGTVTQRLTFVYWEGNTVANGTLAANEHTHTATNGATYFNLRGQLQFAVPASGTNGPVIYIGSLAAGNGFLSEFGEYGGR